MLPCPAHHRASGHPLPPSLPVALADTLGCPATWWGLVWSWQSLGLRGPSSRGQQKPQSLGRAPGQIRGCGGWGGRATAHVRRPGIAQLASVLRPPLASRRGRLGEGLGAAWGSRDIWCQDKAIPTKLTQTPSTWAK